ncbi:MAG: hypothetical protein ACI9W4_002271 [Rhodothermales bacterium]|jgi:uncharacterized protein (DUF1501 family)
MSALGLAGVGSFVAGAIPTRAVLGAPALHPLAAADGERVLVLIQMEGGNDGLNTVIPIFDDRYFRNRPSLAIPQSAALDVGQQFGLHGSLEPLQSRFAAGEMQVIHAVGYDNPDLSHFRSTDIWVSASDSDETLRSGWVGRTVEGQWPQVITDPPASPLAVQIGGAAMMFRGMQTNVGASFRDTEQLARLAEGGVSFDPADVPDTRYGRLMSYTRELANQSYRYAAALQDSAAGGENDAAYPDGRLGEQLAMVARLIKGGLGAKVYHVSLSGFDTHALQAETHAQLLAEFSAATNAFMDDVDVGGRADDVLLMTFSEFGRTVVENGARGTDHATVAPMFLLGRGLANSTFGVMPDLDVVNEFGDVEHIIDFRKVYASVLETWLRIPGNLVDQALGRNFDRLGLFADSVGLQTPGLPTGYSLGSPYPNPSREFARLPISVPAPTRVSVELFDTLGRQVGTSAGRTVLGISELTIPLAGLPPGSYFARVNLDTHTQTRSIVVAGR